MTCCSRNLPSEKSSGATTPPSQPAKEKLTDFLIRYRVGADKVAEQELEIGEFVAAVKAQADPDYRYTVYRKEDGVSFVHHAWIADEPAIQRFRGQPHFKPFADGLSGYAEEGPTVTRTDRVASSAA